MKTNFEIIKKFHTYLPDTYCNKQFLLPVEKSKKNSITLKYNDIYLHSKYDPVNESKKFIDNYNIQDNSIIIVLGIGLGYHLDYLYKKFPSSYFIVIENNVKIFSTFINYANEYLLNSQNIYYFINPSGYHQIEKLISFLSVIKLKNFPKIYIIPHPPSIKLNKKKYNEIENILLEIKNNIYSNYITTKKLLPLWERNINKNLKLFNTSHKLIELKNKFKDKEIVIIGAGPSLENHIHFLKNKKDLIKIAVDTSLYFLIKNNIIPEFVISLDAKFENLYDFIGIKNFRNINLIYDIITFPKIPPLFKNRYITYTYRLVEDLNNNYYEYYEPPVKKVIERYGNFGGLQSGGSVATNALDFALFVNAKKIYLIGIDLKYINYKSHCKGTYVDRYFLTRSNKLFNFETLNFYSIINRKILKVEKDKDGNLIHYDFILDKYKKWFTDAINLIGNNKIIQI